MPVAARKCWIIRNEPLALARQCELTGVARSTVYASHPAAKADEQELTLLGLIDAEYTRHPFYGSRKIRHYLRGLGHRINRKRVQRLMGGSGLAGMAPGPNTNRPHPQHKVYPYLLRGMAVIRPNQAWITDISAPCRRGWRNPNRSGWLPTGSWNAALLGSDTGRKGAAKFCRVLTAGCHKQSSLNCT